MSTPVTSNPSACRSRVERPVPQPKSIARRPELISKRWEIKQRELELIWARNALLPQLDIGGVYRWVGLGDDLISADRVGRNFQDPPALGGGLGSTAYDEDPDGLRAIMDVWSDRSLYAYVRVNQIRAGVGPDGNVSLSEDANAYDDDARDVITGSGGADWFFFNCCDHVTDLHWWEFTDILELVEP